MGAGFVAYRIPFRPGKGGAETALYGRGYRRTVKRLTNLTGFVTDPRWSPDGKTIAILFAENAPGGGGPLEAEPGRRA